MLAYVFSIYKSVKYFDYLTVLQHNTSTWSQPLAETLYKQELDPITAVLACFTSELLDNGVETNCTFPDILCSK